ncbi:MAG: tyrosine-type recombinase/integrase [Bryobacterales bacterium]|nr:tyrosine-type recombinase/integrase [Bryobacterales bacterium]
MFEILDKDPATIARYRLSPLLEERERYLCVVVASGVVNDVARRVARAQLVLMDLLDLPVADIPIRLETVEAGVREWCRSVPEVSAADLRRHGFRWLRFLGWLEESPRDTHPHTRQVEAFAVWMRDDRGLSEATIGNCCYESDRLFAWAADRNLTLAGMTIGEVDDYLAARIAEGGLRGTSARAVAGCLRSFFGFAETRRWCRPGIAGCIMPPLVYPDRPVPKAFDRDDVERLLATTEGATPADVRDRAVLMILATCGLRAGEVGALRVDDIDWERDMLRVFRSKTGRTDLFPLIPSVGNALMDYLLKVRPQAGRERALFLTLQAPFRPLTSGTIGMIVRSRANRLGITGKRLGAHALRHAAAQRLVDEGSSLKTVGDFLGHSSPSATATYAKVDLASLRPVADIGLKELLDDTA